jgi:hypothetical protein
MAQYKIGTVNATKGSNQVQGLGTNFLANVSAGSMFSIPGTGLQYTIGSVDSDTQLSLVGTFLQADAVNSIYSITVDFTPSLGLPEVSAGDANVLALLTQALRMLDVAVSARNTGIVEAWSQTEADAQRAAGYTIIVRMDLLGYTPPATTTAVPVTTTAAPVTTTAAPVTTTAAPVTTTAAPVTTTAAPVTTTAAPVTTTAAPVTTTAAPVTTTAAPVTTTAAPVTTASPITPVSSVVFSNFSASVTTTAAPTTTTAAPTTTTPAPTTTAGPSAPTASVVFTNFASGTSPAASVIFSNIH